jgi:PAS domain S-box-containing protein
MIEAEYLKLLVEEGPDALIAIGADGNVLYWSRGAEATFGYTAMEEISRAEPQVILLDLRIL